MSPRGALGGWCRNAAVLLVALVAACGGSGGDRVNLVARDWQVAALLALLPGQGPATLFVDGIALEEAGEGGIARLLDTQRLAEPALKRVAYQVIAMIEGINSPAELRRLAMTQSPKDAADYLLLADTQSNSIESLYSGELPEPIARYRQVDIYSHPRLDLDVGMLPGALLAIGPAEALRDLIDQLLDQGPAGPGPMPGPNGNSLGFRLELAPTGTGNNTLSLSYANSVTGLFDLEEDTLKGSVSVAYNSADAYVARFNTLAEGTSIRGLQTDGAGNVLLPVELKLTQLADRFYISRLFQAFDGVIYAENVAVGGNPPWLNFDVDTGPNSIFINFEFADSEMRDRFETNELPEGFRLAPLRILEGEEPTYFLVLNIYQSSGGLVNGARAEWSVFVQDPETDIPRFLVVQAAAENISADPVNLLTPPEPVSHVLEDGQVISYVGQTQADGSESLYFRSAFDWPDDQSQTSGFAREFVAANDYIFWGNAVADRGTFNGSVYAREAVLIPNSALEMVDNSYWSRFIKPVPRHTLVYQNPLEIIISPWWNLEADYLDVSPGFLQELVDFSNAFYPATMQAQALSAFRGEGSVIDPLSELPGTLYLHFRISDPQGLQKQLQVGAGIELSPVALVDGGVPDYLLTLKVYRLQDDTCHMRADWVTYFSTATGDRPRALKLLAQASEPCLDADALLYPASRLDTIQDGPRIRLDLQDLLIRVNASVDPSLAVEVLPGLRLLESQDQVCGQSAVCDRRFIDGETLNRKLQQIDPSAAEILELQSPWDSFVEHEPLAVWLSTVPRLRIENPWDASL